MYNTYDRTYNAPGVRGYSPFGQYGNRVQVLLDGHRINDDWLASSFIGFDLMTSLHEVEKVEVIRGPGSAVYGSGAFFGVINLVTPRRVDEFKVTAGLSMVGDGGLRTYGKLESPLGRDGGIRIYAGGLYRQPGLYTKDTSAPDSNTQQTLSSNNLGEEFAGSFLLKAWLGDFTLKAGLNDRTQQIATGAYETIFGDQRTQVQDDPSRHDYNVDKMVDSFVQHAQSQAAHTYQERLFLIGIGWASNGVPGTLNIASARAFSPTANLDVRFRYKTSGAKRRPLAPQG